MNIELIKKYKAEFEHFLNEGDLLCREINIKVPTDWYEFDNDWSWSVDELEIIINDEFSELRKALCDGKTVQIWEVIEQHVSDSSKDIYGWKDFKSFTPSSQFSGPSHHYRIKPEESKFKVGDFVRYINSNNNKALRINNINCGFYYCDDTGMSLRIDEMIKWNPNHKELCWFWSGNKLEEATLSKFHSYTKHGGFKTIYDSFKYCEPFLNSKPSWFKD